MDQRRGTEKQLSETADSRAADIAVGKLESTEMHHADVLERVTQHVTSNFPEVGVTKVERSDRYRVANDPVSDCIRRAVNDVGQY
mmetsp:Transcript_11985/g.38124  ORF Transcript_11985/g.38124 Transcript_11985/m.38124 type:complete len:85 (-) Transcript_11985:6800-7054(-)